MNQKQTDIGLGSPTGKVPTLAQAQLLDSLKKMPNGIRLGPLKSQRKGYSDLPLFTPPPQPKLF